MSFFTNDKGRLIKAVAIGVAASALITAVLLCLCAVVLNFLSGLPYGALGYLTAGILAVGVFFGAVIAAAIAKSRGLIVGLSVAALIVLINLAVSLSVKDGELGAITLIRSAAVLVCGALGGIRGVNRKERIRIK